MAETGRKTRRHAFVGIPMSSTCRSAPCSTASSGWRGDVASVRTYIPEHLDDVLTRIHPERVFDFETDLDGIAEAHATVELTADDLREIDSAASKITVQRARYPEELERMTGR